MIEIKHLKTLGHCGIVDRWLPRRRCCTRPNPLCLISSAIWNNVLASACSCVKPAAALYAAGGSSAATGKPVLPQISRALQACNEPQQTRLRIAIECHSCIQWLTPALENFRASWPQVEMDFTSGVTLIRNRPCNKVSWIW